MKVLTGRVRIIGIERYLVKVPPALACKPQLIARIRVVHQRSEPAEAIRGIVDDRRRRSLQSEIRPVAVDTAVVSEPLRVATEVELIIRLIKVAGAEKKLSFVVAFETRARNNVEY